MTALASKTAPLIDVDRKTGEYISGLARITQSIDTILKTRIGTRIERRWWGSNFLDMLDKPQVQEVFAQGIVAACRYVDMYEPEYSIKQVSVRPSYDGTAEIMISGAVKATQQPFSFTTRIYAASVDVKVSALDL